MVMHLFSYPKRRTPHYPWKNSVESPTSSKVSYWDRMDARSWNSHLLFQRSSTPLYSTGHRPLLQHPCDIPSGLGVSHAREIIFVRFHESRNSYSKNTREPKPIQLGMVGAWIQGRDHLSHLIVPRACVLPS